MRTATPTRIYLPLAATLVACTIFASAPTTSAQQPAAGVQSYTEFADVAGSRSMKLYRWSQSAGATGPSFKGRRLNPDTVSANGEFVAGSYSGKSGTDHHVFVWSKTGGFRDVADFGLWYTIYDVSLVSDDGSVVVFNLRSFKGNGDHPMRLIRWTKSKGIKDLGALGQPISIQGGSADGSTIIGSAGEHCFRWTQQAGFQNLTGMDSILSTSDDTRVIIGIKNDSAKVPHVVRWTEAGGAQDVGTLKRADTKNTGLLTVALINPSGASADGTTIVGVLRMIEKGEGGTVKSVIDHAFVWTQSGGIQDLGDMGGKGAVLQDVSADGTVVLGNFTNAGSNVIHFVSPLPELAAKRQTQLKQQEAEAKAQAAARAQAQAKAAAAQAEQDAKNAAVQADQQARYDKVIKKGRPIQLYSLAGDLEDEGRPDLAANLYQALITRFPDDPYAAKAVDKKDAARAAAAEQQQQQQQTQASAAQPAAANAPSAQAIEACIQRCSSTLNSCKADAQTHHDSAVAKGLVGLLSKNSASVSGAASDVQDADSTTSACNDQYNSCSAACQ